METQYKITSESHPAERSITFLLNGKFGEDSLADLDFSIETARGSHETIYIDLSEVTLVDRKAIQYFSSHAADNVRIVNCPVYLKRWITQVSDDVEN